MTLRRIVATAAVLVTAGLASAGTAQASFHLIQVREVYPGSVANPEAEYVVLQMWDFGQDLVGGHSVRTFGPAGAPTGTSVIPNNVPFRVNQSTILFATPEAEAQFGILADAKLAPSGQIDPSGGGVCWDSGLDCVSWGNFSGSLNSGSGKPAAAIPDGSALRRSIAPGCATFLDYYDDTDDSALDFSAVPPMPRSNATPPSETQCTAPPERLPNLPAAQTTLGRVPGKRTRDRTPRFIFRADQKRTTFDCRMDRKPFRPCTSPYTSKPLRPGRHHFAVRARNAAKVEPTPAGYTFFVLP